MIELDIRTLTLIATLFAALTTVAMYVLWRPTANSSLKIWMIGSASVAMGLFLLGLRDKIPDVASIALANGFVVFGIGCIWASIDAFFLRRPQWLVIGAVTLFVVLSFSYFSLVSPNIVARIILISLINVAYAGVTAWRLVVEPIPKEVAPARTFLIVVLLLHLIYSALRIALTLSSGPIDNFMTSGIAQSSSMIDAIVIIFAQTFGLLALVQGRNLQQLTDAKARADRSNAAKSQFIASMSHEIRTPLNAVIGYGQLLVSAKLEATEKLRATRLLAAGRSLLRLIDDILDFSKFQGSDVSIYASHVDIRAAIQNQIEIVKPDAQERKLTVDVIIEEDVPRLIKFDGERFQQVLLNLLTNAVKFTPRGRIVLHCALRTGKDHRPSLVVTVDDTGVGMTAEQLTRIFNPFERLNEVNAPGTGLGLTIVRTIVTAMGGSISLQSEKRRGTKVVLMIPVEVARDTLSAAPAPAPVSASWGQEISVLVAEDEPRNAEIIEAFLRMAGISVTLARDGAEALELAKKNTYAAILMDVEMPVMNGLEATRAIRALSEPAYCATVPIVALTAYASQEDRIRCIGAGMDFFVPKPIDRDELIRILKSCDVLNPSDDAASKFMSQDMTPLVFDPTHMDELAASLSPERLRGFLIESLSVVDRYVQVIIGPDADPHAKAVAFHNLVSNFGNMALMKLSAMSRVYEERLKLEDSISPEEMTMFLDDVAEGRRIIESFLAEPQIRHTAS